eukprot:TRINITY_DN3616_c0_g7_i1.p2 TRINITY_DN3616_c0_g7~~TRINITY_DN3616_c0_g7_i1.p2  ORF type:complete len:129 (+),score=24.87 TRINITY_DN3616_c0_g7_i1:335-721(+)
MEPIAVASESSKEKSKGAIRSIRLRLLDKAPVSEFVAASESPSVEAKKPTKFLSDIIQRQKMLKDEAKQDKKESKVEEAKEEPQKSPPVADPSNAIPKAKSTEVGTMFWSALTNEDTPLHILKEMLRR